MTDKEVELIAMLIKIHLKIDSLHEESTVSKETVMRYIERKLSFALTEEDKEQILKYLEEEDGPS